MAPKQRGRSKSSQARDHDEYGQEGEYIEGGPDGESDSDALDDSPLPPRSFARRTCLQLGDIRDSFRPEKGESDSEYETPEREVRHGTKDRFFIGQERPIRRSQEATASNSRKKSDDITNSASSRGSSQQMEGIMYTYYRAFLKTMSLEGHDYYEAESSFQQPSKGLVDIKVESPEIFKSESRVKEERGELHAHIKEEVEMKEPPPNSGLYAIPEFDPLNKHTIIPPIMQNAFEEMESMRRAVREGNNQLFHVIHPDGTSRLVLFVGRKHSIVEIDAQFLSSPSDDDLKNQRAVGFLGSASLIEQMDRLLFAPTTSKSSKLAEPGRTDLSRSRAGISHRP
jgi:hypothetical protein